jgi:Holliday junction resolvase RusA-like endonuclease
MPSPHLGGKNANTPKLVTGRRRIIAALARDAGVRLILGPVELTIRFVFEIPPSVSAKERERRMGAFHVFDPDGSNCQKLVEDALVGVAYRDDNQIARSLTEKVWGAAPRTTITVGPAMDP